MGTKTFYSKVNLDLDDILEEISTEELVKELKNRKYDEYDEFGNKYEDDEVEAKNPLDMPNYEFRRYICDILNLGYHVSDDAIINEIKSRI